MFSSRGMCAARTTTRRSRRPVKKAQRRPPPPDTMEGNYFCDEATLAELERNEQIVFRYSTAQGAISREANPNGSLENVAGICSSGRNVLGMMPHPERSAEPELGGTDGFKIFESLVGTLAAK